MAMANYLGLLLGVLHLHFLGAMCKSAVHVDASGTVTPADTSQDMGDFIEMVKRAKAHMAITLNTARMVRSEVRHHVPLVMEKAAGIAGKHTMLPISQAFALMASGEVNCTEMRSEPVNGQLCRLLVGNNTQVAGKLERAVKGLSLRPKTADAPEMVVADKVEDDLLSNLRAALWDMWFCAKRADPPCNPMTSEDSRVKASREKAFDTLHEIHKHAAAPSAAGGLAEAPPATSPSSWVVASPSRHEVEHPATLLQTEEKVVDQRRSGQTPILPASEWATNVINNMLTPPGVTGKLYEAINNLDIDCNLQTDIVRIENDEDGSIKKLRADLLLLHECASMPSCPAEGCCSPKNPTQAVYIQARNDAYKEYHNMEHDDDEAKVMYVDLLKNIAGPKEASSDTSSSKSSKKHHSHHSHAAGSAHLTAANNSNASNSSNKTSVPAFTPDDGSNTMIIMAVILVFAVLLAAIGFVAYKIHMEKSDKLMSGEGGWGEAGEEYWGEEGY